MAEFRRIVTCETDIDRQWGGTTKMARDRLYEQIDLEMERRLQA